MSSRNDHPVFTDYFVGAFEIICALLVLIGFWTRPATLPVLVIVTIALGTTKKPELDRPNPGFWFMASDARTDFAMLMSLLFLLCAGRGKLVNRSYLKNIAGRGVDVKAGKDQ